MDERLGILVLVGVALGALVLAVLFQLVPIIGSELESSVTIPASAAATGTLSFTGTTLFNESVNISTETYKFINESAEVKDKYDVPIDTSQNASYSAAQLVLEITTNSSLVSAAQVVNTTVVTDLTAGTGGNSYATTENVTDAAWGGALMSGGVAGSQWNATVNTNIPTGIDIWEKTALVGIALFIVVITVIFGYLIRLGGVKI